MTGSDAGSTTPRRGRRPGGQDTRQVIIVAARATFAEKGYDGTTMRGVARAAGVDPRLVHHYFDGKDDLFIAAMELPARPRDLLPALVGPGADGIGDRILRLFFSVWDTPQGQERVLAMFGAMAANDDAARMLREFLFRELLYPVTDALEVDQPELRAGLVATQMAGMAITRYILALPPIASADAEDLIAILGPIVEGLITGPLPR